MRSSYEPPGDAYSHLLAGINRYLQPNRRIRFIKQKQISNHNKIAQHLAQMVDRFSEKKGGKWEEKRERSA
jgi:hypothetical protein